MNGHKRGAVLENRKRAQKTFDVEKYRKDFPIFTHKGYRNPLIYLYNGATNQKPKAVNNVLTPYC